MSQFNPFESAKSDLYSSQLTQAFKGYTRIPDIDHAIRRNLDAWEEINLDCAYRHAIDYHRKLISGSTWKLITKTSSKEDRQAKGIVHEMIDNIKEFEKARFAMAECVFRGVTYMYIRGRRRFMKLGKFPAQYWWVPEQLKHIDKWRIRRRYIKGKVYFYMFSIEEERWKPIDSRCLIVMTNTDEERFYTHGNGLVNSLWHAFFAKKCIEEMALKYCERLASGLIKMGINHERKTGDNRTPVQIAEDYIAMWEKVRGNGVLTYDILDQMDFLEVPGTGWQVIQYLLNYYDDLARLLSIGANLPVQAGDQGSYALGSVQENSVMLNARYGRMLIQNAITDNVITLIRSLNRRQFYNCGLAEANMPRFVLPEERDVDAQTAMTIAQGIHAVGGSVITRELYEASQIFTEPIEGEDLVFKSPQQAQPGGESGMPPMPGAPPRNPMGEPPVEDSPEIPEEEAGTKEMETEVVGASDK